MILYEDGVVVVIATGFDNPSVNAKTGEMIQVWILPAAESPLDAVASGHDEVICGDCPLRGDHGRERACYVEIHRAPLMVWRKWDRGGYPRWNPSDLSIWHDKVVRWGAYGDPTFIPLDIVKRISIMARGWTGYTHQWTTCNPDYRKYLMASVETLAQAAEAWRCGWRTFRTGAVPGPGEVTCVNVTHGVQCIDCELCCGAATRAKSIVIPPHGAGARYL